MLKLVLSWKQLLAISPRNRNPSIFKSGTIKRKKRQTRDWEKIFSKHIPDKGLVPKTYKELVKFNNKKTKVNNFKMGKRSVHLTRESIQMANKHMKRCSTSYVITELQIKTTMKYSYTPIRMPKIQHTDNTKCWQGWGTTETLIHCWWECKMIQFGSFFLFFFFFWLGLRCCARAFSS